MATLANTEERQHALWLLAQDGYGWPTRRITQSRKTKILLLEQRTTLQRGREVFVGHGRTEIIMKVHARTSYLSLRLYIFINLIYIRFVLGLSRTTNKQQQQQQQKPTVTTKNKQTKCTTGSAFIHKEMWHAIINKVNTFVVSLVFFYRAEQNIEKTNQQTNNNSNPKQTNNKQKTAS